MKKIVMLLVGIVICCACNDEEKSVATFDPSVIQPAETFIDPRDGHEYPCIQVGNQIWMCENLAYQLPHGAFGGCYTWDEKPVSFASLEAEVPNEIFKSEVNRVKEEHLAELPGMEPMFVEIFLENLDHGSTQADVLKLYKNATPTFYDLFEPVYQTLLNEAIKAAIIPFATEHIALAEKMNGNYSKEYGFLYTWIGAQIAIPEGWHLPSDEEWLALEMALGISSSEAMKKNEWRGEKAGELLNEGGSTGFNIKFAGANVYEPSREMNYTRKNISSYFWTRTTEALNDSINLAIIRSTAAYTDKIWRGTSRISNHYNVLYSVRCVRDAK